MKKVFIFILVILIIIAGAWFWKNRVAPTAVQPQPQQGEGTTVSYACNAGKTITATLYTGDTVQPTTPGEPPVPGGSAHVVLSDGRTFDLKQTLSADGVRYSDGDPIAQGSETFVFWTKGNGALVLENNQEKSYIGCVQTSNDTSALPQVYTDTAGTFSIRLPQGYTTDATYVYQGPGVGQTIHGVKFTIPQSVSTGTNLGSDSYVSVEQLPATTSCTADKFLNTGETGAKVQTVTDGSTAYSYLTSTDAAAGNRYEETVYALPGTNPCIAVRYLIHYSVFENYPAGTVRQFDEASLKQMFDAIRRSLVINQ